MQKELIEYRVNPITRYSVTRYERTADGVCSTNTVGRIEFDRAETAYEVAYAMASADHARKGWALDDPRIQYPRQPGESASPVSA